MRKTVEFDNRVEFEKFEKAHQEKGKLFTALGYYMPTDISISDFMEMQWIVLSFDPYSKNSIELKLSEETNELFIGDMNDAGHVPRCRIMRVPREDIYSKSAKLIQWTENRSFRLWF